MVCGVLSETQSIKTLSVRECEPAILTGKMVSMSHDTTL